MCTCTPVNSQVGNFLYIYTALNNLEHHTVSSDAHSLPSLFKVTSGVTQISLGRMMCYKFPIVIKRNCQQLKKNFKIIAVMFYQLLTC